MQFTEKEKKEFIAIGAIDRIKKIINALLATDTFYLEQMAEYAADVAKHGDDNVERTAAKYLENMIEALIKEREDIAIRASIRVDEP